MINSRCGQYVVTLTPGGKYIYPQYMIDTFWLNVNDTSGNLLWNGRGTNKKAALVSLQGHAAFNNRKFGSKSWSDRQPSISEMAFTPQPPRLLVLRCPPREREILGPIPSFFRSSQSVTSRLVLQRLPCQTFLFIGSVLGLAVPVSALCN